MESAAAPAYMAQGRTCAICGAPAWHIEAVPFCRSHDQSSFDIDEERDAYYDAD
jgi:hypothetical protein